MAIVDMKRLLIVAEREQCDELLLSLQGLGCVELSSFEEEDDIRDILSRPDSQAQARNEQRLLRLRAAITRLSRYANEKTSMFSPKPAASLSQITPDEASVAEDEALLEQADALEREAGELRGRQTRLAGQLDQLGPWMALDLPLSEVRDGRESRQYLGTLPLAALDTVRAETAGQACVIEELHHTRDMVFIWALAHESCAPALAQLLKDQGFVAGQPGDFDGLPRDRAKEIEAELEAISQAEADLQARQQALAKELPRLRRYHDALQSLQDRQQAKDRMLHTRTACLLRGWLPAPQEKTFTDFMLALYPSAQIQLSEPEAGDEPPVLLHNPAPIAPFESIVSGFAFPAPGSLDPTPVLAPFFACFFGMMVSDAGYGIMMMILVPLLIKLMKPSKAGKKLFLVIGIGGVFTVFWGFLYNTWFGFNPLPNPVLDPINRPMEVMILCMGVGVLHLLAGMAMGAVQNIRKGKYLDVIYDQLSWLMLLAGLGMLAVPSLAAAGQWVAIAGALIILVFAGRDKSNNPFKRLVSGLGALYGVTSWLSDILSYLRLFGMGLATGVIGMVFNILIGMVFQIGPIGWVIGAVLFVGCHLFNAGINILGAYVHSARLQYIEFFSKFYEEGGRAFMPLSHQPRFVRITDA